jgi:hypothetical protein
VKQISEAMEIQYQDDSSPEAVAAYNKIMEQAVENSQYKDEKCDHPRIAFKSVYYYSMVLLFAILCSTTEFFLSLINYKDDDSFGTCDTSMEDLKKSMEDGTYYMNDTMDSPLAKLNVEEMNHNFEDYLLNSGLERENVVKVNIILGDFYDGLKLFAKVWSFWPLLINIFNIPPPLRGSFAISHFVATFFANPEGDPSIEGKLFAANPVVDSIFRQFYTHELEILRCGYPFYLKWKGKIYFIQARCIFHCADTRGIEDMMAVQGAGSEHGCIKCDCFHGFFDHQFRKEVYVGHFEK